jgi:hypothetical protein
MPRDDCKYVADFIADCGEDVPQDSDEFSVDDLPGFTDGDWPDFVEQKMFDWLPPDICHRFGRSESTMLNGPMLVLDIRQINEIWAPRLPALDTNAPVTIT